VRSVGPNGLLRSSRRLGFHSDCGEKLLTAKFAEKGRRVRKEKRKKVSARETYVKLAGCCFYIPRDISEEEGIPC
jgi:hypothetical protein